MFVCVSIEVKTLLLGHEACLERFKELSLPLVNLHLPLLITILSLYHQILMTLSQRNSFNYLVREATSLIGVFMVDNTVVVALFGVKYATILTMLLPYVSSGRSSIQCEVCHKFDHVASICFHRFKKDHMPHITRPPSSHSSHSNSYNFPWLSVTTQTSSKFIYALESQFKPMP